MLQWSLLYVEQMQFEILLVVKRIMVNKRRNTFVCLSLMFFTSEMYLFFGWYTGEVICLFDIHIYNYHAIISYYNVLIYFGPRNIIVGDQKQPACIIFFSAAYGIAPTIFSNSYIQHTYSNTWIPPYMGRFSQWPPSLPYPTIFAKFLRQDLRE